MKLKVQTPISSNLSTFTKRTGGHGTQRFLAKAMGRVGAILGLLLRCLTTLVALWL